MSLKLYPDQSKYPWINLISPSLYMRWGRDRLSEGDEALIKGTIGLYFIKNGSFTINFVNFREPWASQTFEINEFYLKGSIYPTKWMSLRGVLAWSEKLYYDPSNPYVGKFRVQWIDATLQPTAKIRQVLYYKHVVFDNPADSKRVYTVHLFNSKSIYQFSNTFSVRAVVQYNSNQHRILSDFLASYTLVPGTVVYAGYGSLIERRRWEDDRWRYGIGSYLTTRRSFFFKASYLWRF